MKKNRPGRDIDAPPIKGEPPPGPNPKKPQSGQPDDDAAPGIQAFPKALKKV